MTTANIKDLIPCDINKVWETLLATEHYPAWRNDVSRTDVIDEKHFTEYTKSGYSTTYTVTVIDPYSRLELDMENDNAKGHWTLVFASKGSETEIDFTASVTAKQLSMRPVGKNVLEQKYLQKEQAQFITDLKKALG